MNDLVDRAVAIASARLAAPGLANRWKHVQAVGQRAAQIAVTVEPDNQTVLIAAAWLHDVGYADDLLDTGLHSLDGARYLERVGFPPRIVALVAHHTAARFEAAERGLAKEIAVYPYEDSTVMDALVTADLTTGPTGASIHVDERLAEILNRYSSGSPVHSAITAADHVLRDHVARVVVRLQQAGLAVPDLNDQFHG